MSFPLLPIPPQIQDAKPEAVPTALLDSDQESFALFFDLADTADYPINQANPEEVTTTESSVIHPNSGSGNGDKLEETPTSDLSVEQAEGALEKHPITLIESAFAPVLASGLAAKLGGPAAQVLQQIPVAHDQTILRTGITPPASPTTHDPQILQTEAPNHEIPGAISASAARPRSEHMELQLGNSKSTGGHTRQSLETEDPVLRTTAATTPTTVERPSFVPMAQIAPTASLPNNLAPARKTQIDNDEISTKFPVEPRSSEAITRPSQAAGIQAPTLMATDPNFASKNTLETGHGEKLVEISVAQGMSDIQGGSARIVSQEHSHPPTQQQHVAKSAANQMAIAVAQNGSGATELVLSPEELGRVRMVMSAQDGGINVVVHTERPETHDLLRRHIETLSQEFKNMGFSTASFTFAQDQQSRSEQGSGPSEIGDIGQDDNTDLPQHAQVTTSEGLDLRL